MLFLANLRKNFLIYIPIIFLTAEIPFICDLSKLNKGCCCRKKNWKSKRLFFSNLYSKLNFERNMHTNLYYSIYAIALIFRFFENNSLGA